MSTKSVLRELRAKQESVAACRDAAAAEFERWSQLWSNLQGTIESFEADLAEEESQLPVKTIRNAIVDILQEHKVPFHYGELLKQLEQNGIEVKGKDPLRLVSAHLSNDDRFTSIGNGYWGMTSWPPRMLKIPEPSVPPKGSMPSAGSAPPVSLRERLHALNNRAVPPPPDQWEPAGDELGYDADDFETHAPDATGTYDEVPF